MKNGSRCGADPRRLCTIHFSVDASDHCRALERQHRASSGPWSGESVRTVRPPVPHPLKAKKPRTLRDPSYFLIVPNSTGFFFPLDGFLLDVSSGICVSVLDFRPICVSSSVHRKPDQGSTMDALQGERNPASSISPKGSRRKTHLPKEWHPECQASAKVNPRQDVAFARLELASLTAGISVGMTGQGPAKASAIHLDRRIKVTPDPPQYQCLPHT